MDGNVHTALQATSKDLHANLRARFQCGLGLKIFFPLTPQPKCHPPPERVPPKWRNNRQGMTSAFLIPNIPTYQEMLMVSIKRKLRWSSSNDPRYWVSNNIPPSDWPTRSGKRYVGKFQCCVKFVRLIMNRVLCVSICQITNVSCVKTPF